MGLEDFTTYTLDNGNIHDLTAYTYWVTCSNMATTKLHDDKGLDYFGDFTHLVDMRIKDRNCGIGGQGIFWMLTKDANDWRSLVILQKNFIFLRAEAVTGDDDVYTVYLEERVDGDATVYQDSVVVPYQTYMYFLIKKVGISLKVGIYSTSNLRDLGNAEDGNIGNLSLALNGNWTFQYIYSCQSYSDSNGYWIQLNIENLNLDATPPTLSTSSTANITSSTAKLYGSIDGYVDVCIERGFEWGTTSGVYPNDWTETGSFETGEFSHRITGLPVNTTIYFRAKARGSPWGYSVEASFTSGYGKFNLTKEGLKETIRACIPEGDVSGNWREDIRKLARCLPFISVRISPGDIWDIYDRDIGKASPNERGSLVNYRFSVHVFHSNCNCDSYSGDPTDYRHGCEKGMFAQDIADRIIDFLIPQPSPLGFDVNTISVRESEPARGGHRVSRVIIEGTIQIKRID